MRLRGRHGGGYLVVRKGCAMRGVWILVSLLAVLLVGVAVGAWFGPGATAQEGTPPAEEEFALPEGVTFAPLAYGTAEELPAAPADLVLFRFGLEPGATFQLDEDDPSVALAYVEEGALTVTMETPMTVLRAAGDETPFPEQMDLIKAGTEFTLEEGDSAIFPANVEGEIRNEGDESATLLVAQVAPLEGEAGTPEAGTPADAQVPEDAVTVEMNEIYFNPEEFSIPANPPVEVALLNRGQLLHNFSIDVLGIKVDVPSGETGQITINAPAGTYEYYCDQPGHLPAGMVGTLTVS